MKTYTGEIGGPCGYTVRVRDGNEVYFLEPRYDLRNHSPDGFCWGYHGSGPAQLALAMLGDYVRDDAFAQRHYQDWKREFVARLSQTEGWTLEVNGSDPLSLFLTRIAKATGAEVRS